MIFFPFNKSMLLFIRPPFINGRPQETDFIFGKKGLVPFFEVKVSLFFICFPLASLLKGTSDIHCMAVLGLAQYCLAVLGLAQYCSAVLGSARQCLAVLGSARHCSALLDRQFVTSSWEEQLWGCRSVDIQINLT